MIYTTFVPDCGSVRKSLVDGDVIANSSDNCVSVSESLSVYLFSCSDVGMNVVTGTVVDGSGNGVSGNVTVTVVDDELPSVTAVVSHEVFLNASGVATIENADVVADSSDNCGVVVSLSQDVFTCSDLSDPTITLTATDPSNNMSNDTVAT